MAYNPKGSASISFLDFDGESSVMRVNSVVLTAGNIAAQVTAFGNLITATQAIVEGTKKATALDAVDTAYTQVLPTVASAQRERKWFVRIQDQVNLGISGFTVPTALYDDAFFPPNSEKADLTNADIASFVTAVEAFVKSPDGNSVVVLDITAVGRNL